MSGYDFLGIATPNTTIPTPTNKVFYILGVGIYNNFGSNTINIIDGYIGVAMYNEGWDITPINIVDVFKSREDISSLTPQAGIIASYNEWIVGSDYGTCVFLPLEDKFYLIKNNSESTANIAVLTQSGVGVQGSTPSWASGYEGRITISVGNEYLLAGSDGLYLYIRLNDSSDKNITPDIYLNSIDVIQNNTNRIHDIILKDTNTKSNYTGGVWFPPSPATIDGTPIKQDGWIVTDYIKVKKGCDIMWLYRDIPNQVRLCVYNLDREFITQYSALDANYRSWENFRSTDATNEYFYIRATFYYPNIGTSYLFVDGNIVWSYKDSTIYQLIDSLADYELANHLVIGVIESGIWHDDYGRSYLIPVSEGDTFYLKYNVSNIYYAFLTDIPSADVDIPYVSGTTRVTLNNLSSIVWTEVVVPKGCRYLCISKFFNSSTDHTPYIKKVGVDLDMNGLVIGTFNSSFNQTDTESIRNEYCGLIKGKDNIETFMFFSDAHLTDNDRYQTMDEFARDRYISALQKFYNSLPLDSCICGGDWLNYSHTDDEACGFLGYCDAYMRKLFKHYLPTFGNHDNNPYSDGLSQQSGWAKALSYTDIKNLMFRQEGKTWYSADGVKTKYYVLNTGVSFIKTMTDGNYPQLVNNRWEQVDWFANKLLIDDAENSVVVMHIFSNANNPSEWFSEETGYYAKGIHDFAKYIKLAAEAYNDRVPITLNGITYDFSSMTGRVDFILTGHTHFDYVDTSGSIPIVCITNLAGGYLDENNVSYKTLQPTFDNCLSDLDNERLYMVRVGAAHSRIINYVPENVAINGAITLSSQLEGTLIWQSRDTTIATVSNGVVAGLTSGCVGIVATDENGKEEYWIVKVS